ncbi:hypothetical protein EB118_21220 [bacterium]|nr:hypothetical protein [bacterium]
MANTVFKAENGLLVIGNGEITGNLSVGGELVVTGNVTMSGNSVGNIIPINNTYSLGNSSQRWITFFSTIDASNAVNFSSTLNVLGLSTLATVNVTSFANVLTANVTNLNVVNSFNVVSNASITGTLGVTGTTTTQNLVVSGAVANVAANINVTGTVHSIGGNVSFDSGVLFVDSANNRVGIINSAPDASLTITGTANVSANVNFGSSFATVGPVSFSNTIGVTGAATFSNSLNLVGAANLQSSANVGGTLGVAGTTTLSGNLSVSSNSSFTANVNIAADLTLKTYSETVQNITGSSTTVSLDLANTGVFNVTIANNITFSFTNPPSSTKMGSFIVITQNDATGGRTIAWPATVKWPGGASSVPPRTTTASALDIWSFFTYDGGTSYIGSLAVKDAKL